MHFGRTVNTRRDQKESSSLARELSKSPCMPKRLKLRAHFKIAPTDGGGGKGSKMRNTTSNSSSGRINPGVQPPA